MKERGQSAFSITPIVDFAALITLFVGTATAAILLEQLGSVQRFNLPITLLEIPNTGIATAGVVLAFALLIFAPFVPARLSQRRSQRTLFLFYSDLTLVVIGLLGIPLIYALQKFVLPMPSPMKQGLGILDNYSMFLVALFPMMMLALSLSPLRFRVSMWLIRRMRKRHQSEADRGSKVRARGRNVPLVFLAEPSPFVIYVLYVCSYFLSSAYAFGMATSYAPSRAVLTENGSKRLVIASYPDIIISTCYDERTHSYAPGYIIQRVDDTATNIYYELPSLTSPYVPIVANPKTKSGGAGFLDTKRRPLCDGSAD